MYLVCINIITGCYCEVELLYCVVPPSPRKLGQEPSATCPIFVPSDPELDWLLVKMFVKHADSVIHQIVSHLMKTHLLAEVFAVATMRHFPDVHPLHKVGRTDVDAIHTVQSRPRLPVGQTARGIKALLIYNTTIKPLFRPMSQNVQIKKKTW